MGGDPGSQTNTWNFVRKISHFFKKIKCSKQPKKQNKLNFYFSLSGVPNVCGGWMGSDVWDKVLKKQFFWDLPLLALITLYTIPTNIVASAPLPLLLFNVTPKVLLISP